MKNLRILPYTGRQDYKFYIDGIKFNGKRKRLYFKTEQEAQFEKKKWQRRLLKEGADSATMPEDVRVMAAKLHRLLVPFGKSVWDAGEFYLEHLNRSVDSEPCSSVFKDYYETKKRAGVSEVYLGDIRSRLGLFMRSFESRKIKSVEVKEIQEWLHSLCLSPVSINNFRAAVSGFFQHAVQRDLIEKNPVDPIAKVKTVDQPPEIFTPAQLAEVLAAAPFDIIPSLAIPAFTGLRNAELLRLDWIEVNQVKGYVEVLASKSKTAQRRLVPIPPNLADWLRPYAGSSGAVWPCDVRNHHRVTKKLLRDTSIEQWPQNGLRHSFCSYHLAKFEDAAKLALVMGHSTTKMIFSNYRELVTPEAADQYWQIRPAAVVANVVAMAG